MCQVYRFAIPVSGLAEPGNPLILGETLCDSDIVIYLTKSSRGPVFQGELCLRRAERLFRVYSRGRAGSGACAG